MKIAFYPGSFSPWHEGHQDIIDKALRVFDKIVILQLTNGDKKGVEKLSGGAINQWADDGKIEIIIRPDSLITTIIGNYILGNPKVDQYAIIRGLRNEKDFCDEQTLQYIYEDLGVKCPVFFIVSDRKLVHISSSMYRELRRLSNKKVLSD